MKKILLALSILTLIISCESAEQKKSAKTSQAKSRIDSTKSGADEITKELDN